MKQKTINIISQYEWRTDFLPSNFFFFLLEAFSLVVDVACLNLKKGKTAMEEYLSKK
jgi:hypothetical protein